MNAPDFAFRAKAKRRVPGVNDPVAAPSWALDFTWLASSWRLRPLADGNCDAFGACAAASSSTAGGSAALVCVCVCVCDAVLSELVELLELDDPQPAMTMAALSAVVSESSLFI